MVLEFTSNFYKEKQDGVMPKVSRGANIEDGGDTWSDISIVEEPLLSMLDIRHKVVCLVPESCAGLIPAAKMLNLRHLDVPVGLDNQDCGTLDLADNIFAALDARSEAGPWAVNGLPPIFQSLLEVVSGHADQRHLPARLERSVLWAGRFEGEGVGEEVAGALVSENLQPVHGRAEHSWWPQRIATELMKNSPGCGLHGSVISLMAVTKGEQVKEALGGVVEVTEEGLDVLGGQHLSLRFQDHGSCNGAAVHGLQEGVQGTAVGSPLPRVQECGGKLLDDLLLLW